MKACRTTPKDLDDVIPVPKSFYINKLHEYADSTPIPRMLNSIENKITSYVPKILRTLYPDITKEYMDEVHQEFHKIMKAYSLNLILKPREGDFIPPRDDFNFQRLGKSKKYSEFLKNRKKIKETLMIPLPVIRCILHYSTTDFPLILNDYSKYRKEGEISLQEFINQARKDLNENSLFLIKEWYPKILKIFKKYYNRNSFPKKMWPRIFSCASGIIKRQIVDVKIRTINHLIEVILDRERIPFLKINAVCDFELDLHPNLNNIFAAFSDIVDDLSQLCSHLNPLETQIDPELRLFKNDYTTNLTTVCLEEMQVKLREALEIAYTPLVEYLVEIRDEYKGLYLYEVDEQLEAFLAGPHTFDEYLQKVDVFRDYITKLKNLVQHEIFDIALINQYVAIQSLREIASNFVDRITINIVKTHTKEDEDICNSFEKIKNKALEIPRTTEQLLENGEYMVKTKTVEMNLLQERIEESLKLNTVLIELTELPPENLQLGIKTINWFHSMKDIFEMNASSFETYKFQFEEHLQEATKKLNEDIEDLFPNICVIDDMTDPGRLHEYRYLLQNIIDKVVIFDDYVKWINKEEVLFKFPKSQYGVLEGIKEYVFPFNDLIK